MQQTKITISQLLLRIKQKYNLQNYHLSSLLNVSNTMMSLYLNGKSNLSIQQLKELESQLLIPHYDNLYNYIFIDEPHSFYHGSRNGIDFPVDIFHSKKRNDFGPGFYLGESFRQTSTFIAGENSGEERIYRFHLKLDDLKVLDLRNPTKDDRWIMLVAYHRNEIKDQNSPIYKKMKNLLNGYDVVIGPIADDRMFESMHRFFTNTLGYEELKDCLLKLNVGNQYCLLSPKSVDNEHLIVMEEYTLDNNIKEIIKEYASNNVNAASSFAVEVLSNKNKRGKLYREILKEYETKSY